MYQQKLLEIKKFTHPPVFFTDRKKISDFVSTLNALPKNTIIIIREYDLDMHAREIFAFKIAKLAKINKLRFLVGKNFDLARKIGAHGVHFSDNDTLPIAFFKKKSFPKNFIFSLSCHSLQSALKLLKLAKPTMVFISPIFPTTSHLDANNLGLRILLDLSSKTKNLNYSSALYALGGINPSNIKSIRKLNLKLGFGAIDFFNSTYNYDNTSNSLRRLWHKIVASFSKLKP